MNAQGCLELLRCSKGCGFRPPVDEKGLPQTRTQLDVMLVEKGKLYFCTARGKEFYRQLTVSGYAAVTGMNREYQMVRLSGQVRKLREQKKWIDRIFEENPSMKEVYPGESRYILEPFCIEEGEAEFFDLGKNPIVRESFCLGDYTGHPKGFRITDSCIGCGKCQKSCPQQCIEKGRPYVIQQAHCLHCGLCYENCPVKAIQKRSDAK